MSPFLRHDWGFSSIEDWINNVPLQSTMSDLCNWSFIENGKQSLLDELVFLAQSETTRRVTTDQQTLGSMNYLQNFDLHFLRPHEMSTVVAMELGLGTGLFLLNRLARSQFRFTMQAFMSSPVPFSDHILDFEEPLRMSFIFQRAISENSLQALGIERASAKASTYLFAAEKFFDLKSLKILISSYKSEKTHWSTRQKFNFWRLILSCQNLPVIQKALRSNIGVQSDVFQLATEDSAQNGLVLGYHAEYLFKSKAERDLSSLSLKEQCEKKGSNMVVEELLNALANLERGNSFMRKRMVMYLVHHIGNDTGSVVSNLSQILKHVDPSEWPLDYLFSKFTKSTDEGKSVILSIFQRINDSPSDLFLQLLASKMVEDKDTGDYQQIASVLNRELSNRLDVLRNVFAELQALSVLQVEKFFMKFGAALNWFLKAERSVDSFEADRKAFISNGLHALNSIHRELSFESSSNLGFSGKVDSTFIGAFSEQLVKIMAMAADTTTTLKTKCSNLRKLHREVSKNVSSLKRLELASYSPFLSQYHELYYSISVIGEKKVKKFTNEVIIINSKNRPKKLVVELEDGTYMAVLLKGMDDLVLDRRLMIIFDAINEVSKIFRIPTSIRTYSVVPCGKHSGLIEWVDNHTQLLSIYKDWFYSTEKVENTGGPSEFYHKVLRDTLTRHGVVKDSWKVQQHTYTIKKEVFKALVDATPSDILVNSLWHSSISSESFSRKQRCFVESTALNSIAGYFFGIGDRHLGNILLDFRSGSVLHIDFSVAFDRGLCLKVPELVPFRLSRNIEAAFGPAGVHGPFTETILRAIQAIQSNWVYFESILSIFAEDPVRELTESNFPGGPNHMLGKVHSTQAYSSNGEASASSRGDGRALGSLSPIHPIGALEIRSVSNKLALTLHEDSHVMRSHVDMIIKQANSSENLARMYHGWMPWF